jgi:hypothetical protein
MTMTTVSGSSEARNRQWNNDESTNAILKRDTGVDVRGNDKTLHDVKSEQRRDVGGAGVAEAGITTIHGVEIAEAGLPVAAEIGAAVVLPIATLGVGFYALHEAHKKGDEQKAAISKDQAHVALAGALDLPAGCKDRAFGDRAETPRGPSSQAFKMTENIMKDKAGLAVLQAHCDRGVISAYAQIPIPMPDGMTLDKFLESRPALKKICDEDAAFKVGFESYWNAGAADRKELLANVDKHDVRSGQTSVHIGG